MSEKEYFKGFPFEGFCCPFWAQAFLVVIQQDFVGTDGQAGTYQDAQAQEPWDPIQLNSFSRLHSPIPDHKIQHARSLTRTLL
jgi:hypothetical protein